MNAKDRRLGLDLLDRILRHPALVCVAAALFVGIDGPVKDLGIHLLGVGGLMSLFISRDEALSWQPATGAAMSSGRIISFVALSQRVFAGTDGKGLLVSSDGERSWALERAFRSEKVRCLLAHDGKVYAGTDTDGVFASNGAGQPWTHLSAGLPSHTQIFALSAVRGRLFAGLYGRGLYAWDEQKRSWVKTGPVRPLALASVHDTLIAGHNPGGLYWSGDLGASWSKGVAAGHAVGPLVSLHSDDSGELSSEAPVWELGSNDDGLVLAGAAAGIYYSEDLGRTWARARKGLPEKSPGIAFLLKQNFVLAGTLIEENNGEAVEPTGAPLCRSDIAGDLGVSRFVGRPAPAPVAHLCRSLPVACACLDQCDVLRRPHA